MMKIKYYLLNGYIKTNSTLLMITDKRINEFNHFYGRGLKGSGVWTKQ